MDIRHLPPMPDPDTGEPRPPAAPLESESTTQEEPRHRARSKVPNPPNVEGGILEWFYPTRRNRFLAGLTLSGIGFIFSTLYGGGFSWVEWWWMWLIILPWPLVFLFSGRADNMSAGAGWLALGDDEFVNTYELVTVKVHLDGSALAIEMVDGRDRSLRPKIGRIQKNHRLWDLVYNGILHSVHIGGAETNKRAREHLRLDHPPHLTK